MLKIAIGLAAVLSMVMIVAGGIEYMTSELISSKEEGKKRITNAVLGLIVALGAFLILNTINPDLIDIEPNIEETTLQYIPGEAQQYRLTQTQNTDTNFKRTSFYDKIKTISAQYNIPHCLLQVAIQRESGGVVGLVGHDENVAYSGIKSRRDFIESGKKYNGTTFTPNNTLITTKTFLNDKDWGGSLFSASNPSASDLGLDWRFSHSVGLFGVTFYPENNSGAKDILNNPDKDIARAATIMKVDYSLCKQDIEQTFRAYGGGKCSSGGTFLNKEAPLRKNLYDQCMAQ
jgi:Type IV secretion system pilin